MFALLNYLQIANFLFTNSASYLVLKKDVIVLREKQFQFKLHFALKIIPWLFYPPRIGKSFAQSGKTFLCQNITGFPLAAKSLLSQSHSREHAITCFPDFRKLVVLLSARASQTGKFPRFPLDFFPAKIPSGIPEKWPCTFLPNGFMAGETRPESWRAQSQFFSTFTETFSLFHERKREEKEWARTFSTFFEERSVRTKKRRSKWGRNKDKMSPPPWRRGLRTFSLSFSGKFWGRNFIGQNVKTARARISDGDLSISERFIWIPNRCATKFLSSFATTRKRLIYSLYEFMFAKLETRACPCFRKSPSFTRSFVMLSGFLQPRQRYTLLLTDQYSNPFFRVLWSLSFQLNTSICRENKQKNPRGVKPFRTYASSNLNWKWYMRHRWIETRWAMAK